MIATDGRPTIANDPNLNKLMAIAAERSVVKKNVIRAVEIPLEAPKAERKTCSCKAA